MFRIGITIGDINGIGPEIIIKAFHDERILQYITPIIYGSYKVMSYHKNIVKDSPIQFQSITSPQHAQTGKINIVNCWEDNVNLTLGVASADGGKYATLAIDHALKDIQNGHLDALVTAPINKESMTLSGFKYKGHTDYLEDLDNNKSLMFMCSEDLKIAVITHHVPLNAVSSQLTKELIIEKVQILNTALVKDFGIEKPIIGVLGLNPHASDNGVIGNEEEKIIRPAIVECKKQGILVSGPFAGDGFFGSDQWRKCDAVLAMYHDQGLIPFKMMSFGHGVNYTAGLSFVRTSPDHGTGFDIAGKNEANPSSIITALFTAMDIAKSRRDYVDSRQNALVKREKQSAGLND